MPSIAPSDTRTAYLPEFGRVVRIQEYDRPMSDDDTETGQTVAFMDELAAKEAADPAIAGAVQEALDAAGLTPTSDPYAIACAVYWWLKRTITYVATPGTSRLVDQTLIAPCTVLAMPDPIGDCPQFSMLAAAMFRVLCMPTRFVTIAAEAKIPDQWSHIYNTVELRPGQWLPFDSSNGPEPGAEYARPFKKRIWDKIEPGDCAPRKGEMIRHGRTGTGRNTTLRGSLGRLGYMTCDDSGSCYDNGADEDTGALVTDPSGLMTGPNVTPQQLAQMNTGQNTSVVGPSGPGLWNTLLQDATSLGSQIIRATTGGPQLVTAANGQQLLINPSTGTATAIGSTALGTLSPTVLLIGVAVLGVALVAGNK